MDLLKSSKEVKDAIKLQLNDNPMLLGMIQKAPQALPVVEFQDQDGKYPDTGERIGCHLGRRRGDRGYFG